jgi:hypothetical protein
MNVDRYRHANPVGGPAPDKQADKKRGSDITNDILWAFKARG